MYLRYSYVLDPTDNTAPTSRHYHTRYTSHYMLLFQNFKIKISKCKILQFDLSLSPSGAVTRTVAPYELLLRDTKRARYTSYDYLTVGCANASYDYLTTLRLILSKQRCSSSSICKLFNSASHLSSYPSNSCNILCKITQENTALSISLFRCHVIAFFRN